MHPGCEDHITGPLLAAGGHFGDITCINTTPGELMARLTIEIYETIINLMHSYKDKNLMHPYVALGYIQIYVYKGDKQVI